MSEKIWTTRHGDKIPYEKLDTGHLINIIAMLERQAKEFNKLRNLYPFASSEVPDLEALFSEIPAEEIFPKLPGLREELQKRAQASIPQPNIQEEEPCPDCSHYACVCPLQEEQAKDALAKSIATFGELELE